MELVTKEYLEDNIKTYDTYRGLDKIGAANGIATLDANGLVTWSQIPQLGDPNGIATLDSNGTVPASQLDLTSVVTVTPSITSSDTGAYSVGSVTVNNTTVDLYGRDTPVTVTPSITSSDPDAYLAGTIVANGITTDLYGKDTTYQVATTSEAGLVKIGNNNKATGTLDEEYGWHPVQLNNDNQAYVHVSSDAELWRKLYPTSFFTITLINSNTSDNYYGCTIGFPSVVKFVKVSYAPFSALSPVDFKQRGRNYVASSFTCTIQEAEKVFHKSYASYIFLDVITNSNGDNPIHFNLAIMITPEMMQEWETTQQPFNATLF